MSVFWSVLPDFQNKRLVFAGGGHAHLYSLARTAELTASNVEVILVDPSPHLFYSGMATGVLSGRYAPDEHCIDVRRLVEAGGGRFVRARVEEIHPKERVLSLSDGSEIPYDAVSFCLGGESAATADPKSLPVKPVGNLLRLREEIFAGEVPSLAVIGGGAAGCEVAANAASAMRTNAARTNAARDGRVTLFEAGPEILTRAPGKARRIMRARLADLGVEVVVGRRLPAREPESGSFGRVAAATGVSPPQVFARSGLTTGEDGGLWVDHFLKSVGGARIFGGGDCVCFRGESLPRFGVFAVRQGPILFHNLRAALFGGSFREYKPPGRFLYILDLADGTALAVYGSLAWRGRAAMWLKSAIDRRFVRRYRLSKRVERKS